MGERDKREVLRGPSTNRDEVPDGLEGSIDNAKEGTKRHAKPGDQSPRDLTDRPEGNERRSDEL